MARVSGLAMMGVLGACVVGGVLIFAAVKPPEPGSAAHFRSMSAASGRTAPYSVPVNERRNHADTCTGYNLELEEAAGIQRRIGHTAEAERLLAMRQNCAGANPNIIRSAR
jgi:hypothetical protein